MPRDSSKRDILVLAVCLAVGIGFIVAAFVQELYSTMILSVPFALTTLWYLGYRVRKRS